MKRSMVIIVVLLLSVVITAQRGGPSPEQQAALAKQAALEKSTPQLQATEEVLTLVVPGHTIGEAVGVAKNSRGHLFVFTRSGNAGPAKGATASQLFEFDPSLKFVKQWGPDNVCFGTEAPGSGGAVRQASDNPNQAGVGTTSDNLLPVIDSLTSLSEEDKLKIINKNPMRVFPGFAKALERAPAGATA